MVRFDDGSAIQGTTDFTRADGTTGTAADAILAYRTDGNIVEQTVTSNADGSTTIVSTAKDENGVIADVVTSTLSADGLSRTVSVDSDGDGITDRVMNEVTVGNADGSETRTNSYYDGSGVMLERAEVTETSADGSVVSVSRDADGSGTDDNVGTRAGNSAASFAQVSASRAEKARMRSCVVAMSVDTPSHRPSERMEAKQSVTGTNSSPCRASSSP